MAQLSVILWMIVLAFISAEVSAFAKLIDRPLGEKVGITLNKISESLLDSEAKTNTNEVSETRAISVNDELAIVLQLLERVPLIDGHNDLPHVIRLLTESQLASFNLTDLSDKNPWSSDPMSHTDIVRLRKGKVGAQFWVAYTNCNAQYNDSPQKAFEQIDLIYRLIDLYSDTFQLATTAQEIEDVFGTGKIASLIGVEGGHAIGNSLSLLRIFYRLGVRYMTLTHSCPTPWADNSQLDNPGQQPIHDGLSGFGEAIVQEMNRLGMMVDISHVSVATMEDVLNVSQAPVIFSHSGAFSVCNHTRNVPDHVLRRLAKNGGIIMVVFYNEFLSCEQSANINDVVRHIEHIRNLIGVDHIGLGGDFNGVDRVPTDLEDVSKYPNIFVELLRLGWSETDVEKLAGTNMLRVMRRVEQVKQELSFMEPIEEWIPTEDLRPEHKLCLTNYI
ncbi:dipeptidase 1-like [Daphnia carinata]|uniref:dipeptidase 1-like n=1 Tax=Daphnia carinata TaxID=120202 RepID=UPI00257FBFBE|nr:dipeptidase 1-like [Daphnia carinata]